MPLSINDLSNLLAVGYEKGEADLIAKFLYQDLDHELRDDENLKMAVSRLLKYEPLQYITGKAHFLNYTFFVDNRVLIPRPETEELVIKAISKIKEARLNHILDIGCGSGCIAVSIKDRLRNVNVTALDVSEGAILVAKTNADRYKAEIDFLCLNFLEESNWNSIPRPDLIISNPPYISFNEAKDMKPNVLMYEPHLALFAGEDPIIFYDKLSQFAMQSKCSVICEMNEFLHDEIKNIFIYKGFHSIEIFKDLQGKNRILFAEC